METSAEALRGGVDRRLYILAALAAVIIVFAGFARTYYLKGAYGGPALSGLVHLHGLVMTLWISIFVLQTTLVATGNTAVHQRVGVFGAVVAALVVIVGVGSGAGGGAAGSTNVPLRISPRKVSRNASASPLVRGSSFSATPRARAITSSE
jgi:hypothetical protein